MDTDIDGDFKKARGFLVTYAALILVLWYFGADLSSFKLMGNEVQLKENVENVWLILALANIYFWFRYIQKLPPGGLRPDDRMKEVFEAALINCTRLFYWRRLVRVAESNALEDDTKSEFIKILPFGRMKYKENADTTDEFFLVNVPGLRKQHGNTIVFSVAYLFRTTQGGEGVFNGITETINPNKFIVVCSRVIGFVRGILLTSWMTDYIFPILFGAFSISVALSKWWQINFV